MTTNNVTEFRKEDYQGSPSWWDRALYNLNLLIDFVVAMNQTITTLSTTLAAVPVFQTVTVTQTSSATSTTAPATNTYSFTSTLRTTPKQLLLSVTNSSFPVFTTPPTASWHYVNGTVYIDAIAGLANSTQYTFTITIF